MCGQALGSSVAKARVAMTFIVVVMVCVLKANRSVLELTG